MTDFIPIFPHTYTKDVFSWSLCMDGMGECATVWTFLPSLGPGPSRHTFNTICSSCTSSILWHIHLYLPPFTPKTNRTLINVLYLLTEAQSVSAKASKAQFIPTSVTYDSILHCPGFEPKSPPC